MIKALINYFVKGLLFIVPIGLTIYFVVWAVKTIDYTLNLSDLIWMDPKTGKPIYIPGLGLLSVILLIMLAGLFVTSFITQPIYNWLERWLKRFPVFSFIYGSIKDFTEAFVGDEKKFDKPVLIEMNDSGIKKVGFLTQKDLKKIGLPGEVAVYVPFSYSFAGQLYVVPADKVQALKMKASEAMKFAVSGGVSQL
ncbi:MAG: hypothetical protein RI924_992 [Bacteroidota bacterium]|jgi:uncharacterized membrane protein